MRCFVAFDDAQAAAAAKFGALALKALSLHRNRLGKLATRLGHNLHHLSGKLVTLHQLRFLHRKLVTF